MGRKKRENEERDHFAHAVGVARTARWLADMARGLGDDFLISRECEDNSQWDDFEVIFEGLYGKRRRRYQIKRQSTELAQTAFSDLIAEAANRQDEYDEFEFVIRDWVKVKDGGNLRILGEFCDRCRKKNVSPNRVTSNLRVGEADWFNMMSQLTGLAEHDMIAFLGRLHIKREHTHDLYGATRLYLSHVVTESQAENARLWLHDRIRELNGISQLSGLQLLQELQEKYSVGSPKTPNSNGLSTSHQNVMLSDIIAIVSTWNEDFRDSYGKFEISGQHLIRSETSTVMELILSDEGPRIVLLAGAAGYGKSGVLFDCFETLQSTPGVSVLGIRADRVNPNRSIQQAFSVGGVETSPESTLKRATNATPTNRAVLVLDQLDALSEFSAQNASKFDFYNEIQTLINRAVRIPNMRVLIACREFDLKHDSRFRVLAQRDNSTTIRVAGLDKMQVADVVQKCGYTGILSDKQIALLESPLHLKMACEILVEAEGVSLPASEWRLYRRFWHLKERASRAVLHPRRWTDILCQISGQMIDKRSDILDRLTLNDISAEIDWLCSENVLVPDRHGRIAFFHASFGDYVFASCFKGKVTVYLREHDQYLARRNQVRALLLEMRVRAATTAVDKQRYLETLAQLLASDSGIRAHIQYMVASVLSAVMNPWDEELNLVLKLLKSKDIFLHEQATRILWANSGWFPLLERRGLLAQVVKQVASGDLTVFEEGVSQSLFVALLRHGLVEQPDAALQHLGGLLKANTENTSLVIRKVFALHPNYLFENRSVFEFLLQSISASVWDQHSEQLNIFELPRVNTDWLLDFVVAFLRRNIILIRSDEWVKNGDWKSTDKTLRRLFEIPTQWELIEKSVNAAPEKAVRLLFPLLVGIISEFSDDVRCHIWSTLVDSGHISDDERFLFCVRDVASDYPALVASLPNAPLEKLAQIENDVAAYVFLSIWAAGDVGMVERAVGFIHSKIKHQKSLNLPDDYITVTAVFNAAFMKLGPHQWRRVLTMLLGHYTSYERMYCRGRSTSMGVEQLKLLAALPTEALDLQASRRLKELRRKYNAAQEDLRPTTIKGGVVSTLDRQVKSKKMSDDDWIAYIGGAKPSSNDFLYEPDVDRTLRHYTEKNPQRFVTLLNEQFNATLPASRFNAVLDGCRGNQQSETTATDASILDAIRKSYKIAPRATARAASRALRRVDTNLPHDVLEILHDQLLNHSNPTTETWQQGYYGEEPYSAGINSVRGSVAETLAHFIQRDSEAFDLSRDVICAAARDPSIQVRSCVATLILCALNHDRDFAVTQFLCLVDEADDRLLSTPQINEFLRYTIGSHFDQLKLVVCRMLNSTLPSVRQAGGRALMLSTFQHIDMLPAIITLIESQHPDAPTLKGVAQVFAANGEKLSDAQETILLEMFDLDVDDDVLQIVSRVFRNASNNSLLNNERVLEAFTRSRAFRLDPSPLIWAIRKSNARLTETILLVCERFIAYCADEAGDIGSGLAGDTHSLMDLLIRVYTDNEHDTEVLDRTLDVIDRLIRAGIWAATSKLERSTRWN